MNEQENQTTSPDLGENVEERDTAQLQDLPVNEEQEAVVKGGHHRMFAIVDRTAQD